MADTASRFWHCVGVSRISDLGVQPVMSYGLGYYPRVDSSLAGQGVEDGDHHVADVHFEESAKSVAGVAASEAVSAEGVVRTWDPTGYLAGHQLQLVRDGHHGAFAIGQ